METQSLEHVDPALVAGLDGLILYEDVGTGLRAKQALDLGPGRFGPDAPWGWRLKLWKLELLGEPVVCERSAMEGATADVIILSVHGQTGVPPTVRDWLERWLRHKQDRPYALGVLLDAEEATQGGENPVVAYCMKIAAGAGADLFCGFCDAPVSGQGLVAEEVSGRGRASSREVEATPWHDGAHEWGGLNE
jgi:hypothetical protein